MFDPKSVGLLAASAAALAAGACAVDAPPLADEHQLAQAAPAIEPRRSLAITELPILERFGLERVLDQLVATSGVPGLDARTLFQQGWDVFNPGPGLGLGPHCDDTVDPDLGPTLNGFPYTCRPAPAEGAQATCDPFTDPASPCAYLPIGLFMRFDLAPEDGRHCGEYRIAYAKQTGRTEATDRNLIIVEAALRNPHVNQGLRGCRKLVEAWASLSTEDDLTARADLLEEIYFDGYREFDPVIQWSNLGDNPLGAGQLRTNQFVQPEPPRVWSLRELKLRRVCAPTCTLGLVPVTAKVNPYGPLFASADVHPRAAAFHAELVARVPGLTAATVGGLGLAVSDAFNSGQSQAAAAVVETNYAFHFGAGAAGGLRPALAARLAALGSPLSPDDVVARTQAMSCAGCHRFSNGADLGGGLTWPPSLGFTHVSERDADLELAGEVVRYRLSPALIDHFLPARAALVEDYLADRPRPARPPDAPLGNRWSH